MTINRIYYAVATLLVLIHFTLYWAAKNTEWSPYLLGVAYQLSIKVSFAAAIVGIILTLTNKKEGRPIRTLVLATLLASFGFIDFLIRFMLQP